MLAALVASDFRLQKWFFCCAFCNPAAIAIEKNHG
jgi:hypothetical protein